MGLKHKVQAKRIELIGYNLIQSCFTFILILMTSFLLFLLLPSMLIRLGLVDPLALLVIVIMALFLPAAILFYRRPISGQGFLKNIVHDASATNKLNWALELEAGRFFAIGKTKANEGTLPLSQYLAERFRQTYVNQIKSVQPWHQFFSDNSGRLLTIFLPLILLTMLLSFWRSQMLYDVYSALRSGLPVEMVAIGDILKFNNLQAEIIPPAYIDNEKSRLIDLNNTDQIKVLGGSRILISAKQTTASRLSDGKLILATEKGLEYFPVIIKLIEKEKSALSDKTFTQQTLSFQVSFLAPDKGAFILQFNKAEPNSDQALLAKSRIYRIETLPDQPPKIRIDSPPDRHEVSFGQAFPIVFSASDDYGILEINLYHRNPKSSDNYYKELIARFPKKAVRNHNGRYVWNPILRDGHKVSEIVYPPDTKEVEYYIEARDTNIFASQGIAQSQKQTIIFKNNLQELRKGERIVEQLIRDGKELIKNWENESNKQRLADEYDEQLGAALDQFRTDLSKVLPRDKLEYKTQQIKNQLKSNRQANGKEQLVSYVDYLQKYNLVLQLAKEIERATLANDKISRMDSQINKTNGEHSKQQQATEQKNKLEELTKFLEQNFAKELDEIDKLIREGKVSEARQAMNDLLQKAQKQMAEQLQQKQQQFMELAKEIEKKLDELIKMAEDIKENEQDNKRQIAADKSQQSMNQQKQINQDLQKLSQQTKDMSDQYPFILGELNSHALSAEMAGKRTEQQISKGDKLSSLREAQQVINHLENFKKASDKQKQRMQQMAQGNMEQVMPQEFTSQFVFIPKEALYTLPIDYKKRVIEMSKDRSKLTPQIEKFWRNLLE